jgi:predicted metal-dependent enzyme (double-stranded beta helix superfamily)
MFDLQGFIAGCEAAVINDGGQPAVRELMASAMQHREAVVAALGEPTRAGIEVLHRSTNVTVLNLVWGPHMTVMPHNHHMWAVIGIYGGREDNIFWRVLPPDGRWPIEAAGASSLMPGDSCPLGRDIIHSVTNPLGKLTGALHVYGGDFLSQMRSEWNEETLQEGPYDTAKARRLFEESNRALQPMT